MSFFSGENSFVGIDIGASGVKVVELKKAGKQIILETYGFSEDAKGQLKYDWRNDPQKTAYVINKICRDAGVKSRSAISALPTYAVFSSVLNLPNVSDKELDATVNWEAKKVVPLPLEEMILDWRKIETGLDKKGETANSSKNIKVLLTGAPKSLIKKYIDIFKEARFSLTSLETETFSLIRSLVGNDRSLIMIVEIGSTTTDLSIVNNGIPILSRSIDLGGAAITERLARVLNVDASRAEQFKYDLGISAINSRENSVPKTIVETIGPIIDEIKFTLNMYQNKDQIKVEKIILSGGSALLVNLSNYLSALLDIKIIVGDPWARIDYSPDLELVLNEIGPRMAVAAGLALRGAEK